MRPGVDGVRRAVRIFDQIASSSGLPLVPVMKSADFRTFNHRTKLGRLNGSRLGGIFAERQVSARAQVQLINTTPIAVVIRGRFIIPGTLGTSARFGSTKPAWGERNR